MIGELICKLQNSEYGYGIVVCLFVVGIILLIVVSAESLSFSSPLGITSIVLTVVFGLTSFIMTMAMC